MRDYGTTLVTGASGFVGANLARVLIEQGRSIRVLVRSQSDRRNIPKSPLVEIFEGDLRNSSAIDAAVDGCKEVYHVAADYRFWSENPKEIYQSNVDGTQNILDSSLKFGVRKVIYTSTVGTIGLLDLTRPCNETTQYDSEQWGSHYKRSKLQAEQIALSYVDKGLPVVVVNPSTPIGAWDRKPTPTGKIILDFVHGKIPAYVHTGLNFVHVRDVALGHILAAEKGKPGERYILGNQNLSMIDFLELLASLTGRKPPRFRIPYALAYVLGTVSTKYSDLVSKKEPAIALEAVKMSKRFMFFDSSKAIQELGLPQTPVKVAILDALDWYSNHGFLNQFSDEVKHG
jgi:dihydroflavonol-4-reductase